MNYELHELCEIIPSMDDSEYLALVADIRDNGLINPIIIFEGKILDGRHRYKACVELDLEPSFVEYTGNKPSSFVRSVNLERRHFEKSQRSMIISLLQNWDNSHPAYRVKKEVVINNHLSTTADRINRKNVHGQMKNPSRKAYGRPKSTPYIPPREPWWNVDKNAPMPANKGIATCRLWARWWSRRFLFNCFCSRIRGTYSMMSTRQ